MLIFKPEGQRALLEFLRNLTPQVLLGGTALLLWGRGGSPIVIFGSACAGAACTIAFLANINLYLDVVLQQLEPEASVVKRFRRRYAPSKGKTFRTIGILIKRRRWTVLLDIFASLALVNAALLAVLYAAVTAAKSALR